MKHRIYNHIKVALCVLMGCAFMASPVFFSDIVQGKQTSTASVFPLDQLTRNYSCESGYYGLTFDDGPFPGHTEKLVAELKRLKVTATFFNTGQQASAYPKLVALEKTVGQVAGHSYGHDNYTSLHPSVVAHDIKRTQKALPGIKLYRPPFGASSAAIRREERKAGLVETMWTVDTKDYEEPHSIEQLTDAAARVKDGGNILLHDGWPSTIKALPHIINEQHARGLCPGKLVISKRPLIMGDSVYSPYPFYAKAVKP